VHILTSLTIVARTQRRSIIGDDILTSEGLSRRNINLQNLAGYHFGSKTGASENLLQPRKTRDYYMNTDIDIYNEFNLPNPNKK